jgi:hypothetical protein
MPTVPMPTTAATPPLPAPPSADAGDPFAESDPPAGQDAPGPDPPWVSLDARTGRLVCPSLDLEVEEFTGRITRSRLVRVFGGGSGEHDEEESGGALCASENRRVADHGRPGRECAGCEDRGVCTPRWRIVWEAYREEEPGSGLAFAQITFAHTLSAAGTVSFTRYALALRRAGLRPHEVLTRLSVEELRRPGAETPHRRLRFEKIGLSG